MSNNTWPNGLYSENGLEIYSIWAWIMYVLWNLPTSPVLYLSKCRSNVKTISAAEAGISTTSTPPSFLQVLQFYHALGLKIAIIITAFVYKIYLGNQIDRTRNTLLTDLHEIIYPVQDSEVKNHTLFSGQRHILIWAIEGPPWESGFIAARAPIKDCKGPQTNMPKNVEPACGPVSQTWQSNFSI